MGTYTVELAQNSKQVKTRLETLLAEAGFHTAVSFDLQSARMGDTTCTCPYHGISNCTCQYEVLLVDDPKRYPGDTRTITIHGRDDITWVSLPAFPFTPQTAKPDTFGKKLRRILLKSASIVEA